MTVQVTSLVNRTLTFTSAPGISLRPFATTRLPVAGLTAELINMDRLRQIEAQVVADEGNISNLSTENTPEANRANTNFLQSALNSGGDIDIVEPGIYNFDVSAGPMVVRSFTSLYVGAGVTLRVADGSPSGLFTNTAARSVGQTVLAANASYATAPDGNGYVITLGGLAGRGGEYPVNSWVSAVTKGHGVAGAQGTAWNNRGYRGLNRVVASTPNSISLLIYRKYPGSAPANDNVVIYKADERIRVWGPGTIDGNGALASQIYNTGDPRGNVMWWRHVVGLRLDDLFFLRGVTWTIGSNYVRDYTTRNLACELRATPGFAAVDFIHLSGQHDRVLIEGSMGGSADNYIGMTIDVTDIVSFPTPNVFDFPFQDPGDMTGITVQNTDADCVSEDGFFGVIGIYGPAAYRYTDVKLINVGGQGSSAIQLSNYPPTGMNKLIIDRLIISDCRIWASGAQVRMDPGIFDIGQLRLESVADTESGVMVLNIDSGATGIIRDLVVSNAASLPYNDATQARNAPMIQFGGVDIGSTRIQGMGPIPMQANVKLITRTGAGTLTKLVLTDVVATGSGTGAVWNNTGGGAAPTPVYERSSYNGTPL